MGWAPQRHVLAEDAVPDVIEREADHRVEAAAGHQNAADRRVPVAGDAHRCRARFVERQYHRDHAGHKDAEQADDDEVMRRIGQRTGVAAIADVPADIPDEAEQRADDRRREHQDGQRDPRWAVELVVPAIPQRVVNQVIRCVRCAQPTYSITAPITIAATDRPITWLRPAPRAGGSREPSGPP